MVTQASLDNKEAVRLLGLIMSKFFMDLDLVDVPIERVGVTNIYGRD
jgi:hypothetical protein